MAVRLVSGVARHCPRILAAAFAASAGLAGEIPEPLRRCAEIGDDTERLACYDRYAARGNPSNSGDAAASAERSAPAAADPAATVERSAPASADSASATENSTPAADKESATAASAEARFGLPENDDEEELDEIGATIADIVVRANQERLFTLDNGQVWVEDSPRPSMRLEVGDKVRISAGLFGSHRLYGPHDRSTAVDRVR